MFTRNNQLFLSIYLLTFKYGRKKLTKILPIAQRVVS